MDYSIETKNADCVTLLRLLRLARQEKEEQYKTALFLGKNRFLLFFFLVFLNSFSRNFFSVLFVVFSDNFFG